MLDVNERKTSGKTLKAKVKAFKKWLQFVRHQNVKNIMQTIQTFVKKRGLAVSTFSNYICYSYREIGKRFMDTIRNRTKRRISLNPQELIDWINPVIRGWGNYYRKAHVRKLFNRLQRWIIRRIWSHKCKRWRNTDWINYSEQKLYKELKLVNLLSLISELS